MDRLRRLISQNYTRNQARVTAGLDEPSQDPDVFPGEAERRRFFVAEARLERFFVTSHVHLTLFVAICHNGFSVGRGHDVTSLEA